MQKCFVCFLFSTLLSTFQISAQEQISRTVSFIDSLDNISNPISWGEGMEYILNVEKLADIALVEDSFNIYESCRLSIQITYYELGDYAGFSNAIQKSTQYADDTLNNASVYFKSNILHDKALLYRLTGDLRGVLSLRLNAIDLVKDLNEFVYLKSFLYMALVVDYNSMGDFVKSREYCLKAILMLAEIEFANFEKAFFYSVLGKIDSKELQYSSAISNFKKSFDYLAKDDSKSQRKYRLNINNNLLLAEIYIELNDLFEAKILMDKVVDLHRESGYRKYRVFEVKSKYYSKLENKSKTILNLQEAIRFAIRNERSDSEYSVIPRMYFNLAEFYSVNGQLDLGLKELQKGLCYFSDSLIQDLNFNPSVLNMKDTEIALKLLTLKSELLKKRYHFTKSESDYISTIKSFQFTLEMLALMRKSFLQEDSKFYVLEKALPVYDSFLQLVYDHFLTAGELNDQVLVYEIMGETKSAILSDKVDYKNIIKDLDIDPKKISKEKELRLKRALYEKVIKKKKMEDSIDSSLLTSLKDSLFEANQDYTILDNKIREEKAKQGIVDLDYNMNAKDLMSYLEDGEMAIDFYVSKEYIYSVTLFEGEMMVDRVELAEVNTSITEFIDLVSNPPSSGGDREILHGLSEVIASSLLKSYFESLEAVKKLRILPSGILNSLPFEALTFEKEGRNVYLVEECPIIYSLSRSQLLKKTKLADEINVMAVAPKFKSGNDFNCEGVELYNLKYAQEEVNYINTTFQKDSLSEHSDNSSYFLNNVVDYNICHLATHGCVNPNDPLLSEIFFSDGSINSYDVLNLDTDISLMVLSACNSASGENIQGEGVISLTRGFFEAGVNNTISSLWAIDDYSSSQIIKGIYKGIEEGNSYSEALRQSKLDYLEVSDKLRSHPYYWAGLIQIGAGVEVLPSSNWGLYLLGGLLLFGVFLLIVFKRKKSS